MKRPPITPGPWNYSLNAAQKPAVYVTDQWFNVMDSSAPIDAEANARAIAALPALLEALEGLLADKYLAEPINADRMKPARAALRLAGYEF
jgi:hypothetical protein